MENNTPKELCVCGHPKRGHFVGPKSACGYDSECYCKFFRPKKSGQMKKSKEVITGKFYKIKNPLDKRRKIYVQEIFAGEKIIARFYDGVLQRI